MANRAANCLPMKDAQRIGKSRSELLTDEGRAAYYFDYLGILRQAYEDFYDSQGIIRKYDDNFYDGLGNMCER